jgi:hypothetical protein
MPWTHKVYTLSIHHRRTYPSHPRPPTYRVVARVASSSVELIEAVPKLSVYRHAHTVLSSHVDSLSVATITCYGPAN